MKEAGTFESRLQVDLRALEAANIKWHNYNQICLFYFIQDVNLLSLCKVTPCLDLKATIMKSTLQNVYISSIIKQPLIIVLLQHIVYSVTNTTVAILIKYYSCETNPSTAATSSLAAYSA